MDCEKLYEILELVVETTEKLKGEDNKVFMPFIAMLLEERAKATGTDVVELADAICDSVHKVNEELGKY